MSTDGRPDITNEPEKDLFLKVYEEQLELLSPEARDFCRQRFPLHADLIPWILRLRSTEDLNCDMQMRRDMAVFIAKIRFLLEEAGYPLVEDDTPEESHPRSLFPRLKSLWHSLTTPTSHDDGFDDFFEKVARIEISATRIRLYASYEDLSLTDELLLIKKEGGLYVAYDGDAAEKEPLDINAGYFDSLCEEEREHRQWLDRLRTVLLRFSDDRLVVFSDFYTIKIFDKSNRQSCSLYTLIRWIENHSIWDVAKNFHVNERPSDRHPWNFPGKFHY